MSFGVAFFCWYLTLFHRSWSWSLWKRSPDGEHGDLLSLRPGWWPPDDLMNDRRCKRLLVWIGPQWLRYGYLGAVAEELEVVLDEVRDKDSLAGWLCLSFSCSFFTGCSFLELFVFLICRFSALLVCCGLNKTSSVFCKSCAQLSGRDLAKELLHLVGEA